MRPKTKVYSIRMKIRRKTSINSIRIKIRPKIRVYKIKISPKAVSSVSIKIKVLG